MQFHADAIGTAFDAAAGGMAAYQEFIPAIYGNYIWESPRWEVQCGLRAEYAQVQYSAPSQHPTYKSGKYRYAEPFPNVRAAYKFGGQHKISVFYSRRVDRPNEVDIRIFPKYDDAEIIKVGNPALRPQFTNAFEAGYRTETGAGAIYAGIYHKITDAAITRIASAVEGSDLIYAVFQNAGGGSMSGIDAVWTHNVAALWSFTLNANFYLNRIDAFSVENLYPEPHRYEDAMQRRYSGSVKLSNILRLPYSVEIQVQALYFAPDVIVQGETAARFALNIAVKKSMFDGRGEVFAAIADLASTMHSRKTIHGANFAYTSDDYCETQDIRLGYRHKF
jgi:outer membrane receptor protein involved in Fe transport